MNTRKRLVIEYRGHTGTTDEIAALIGVTRNRLMAIMFAEGKCAKELAVGIVGGPPKKVKWSPTIKKCLCCNSEFTQTSSALKFCTVKCRKMALRNRLRKHRSKLPCKTCGKMMEATLKIKYCSKQCRPRSSYKYTPVPKIPIPCDYCGVVFTPPNKSINTCSNKCYRARKTDKHLRDGTHHYYTISPATCKECHGNLPSPRPKHQVFCCKACSRRWRDRLDRQNPAEMVRQRLSNRLREMTLKHRGRKTSSILSYIGCDIEVLRSHIESQFRDGMTWDNYGVSGWHLDHLIPCSFFNLTKEDHIRVCFNWQNIRPLSSKDNCIRNDAMTQEEWESAPQQLRDMAEKLGISKYTSGDKITARRMAQCFTIESI